MQLHLTQDLIAQDRHRFRVICCGRRWGKTTLAVEEIKGCALYKKSRIAYIAPTIQQARDIAWQMLKQELRPIIVKSKEAPSLELEVKGKQGNSIIQLRGWESIETLRGQSFDLIVIDEIASMRNWLTNWSEVIRPTLTDRRGEAIFISTPKGFNHFYELFNLEAKDTDFRSFHYTSYDNPFLPKDELDKARLELTEDRFAQEYLADFRKTEGLVYKEFDRTRHLFGKEETFQSVEKVAGIDFGFTNPTAIITVERDRDENYWVTEEVYRTGMTDAQTAELVAAGGFHKVFPDPESPSAIAELRKRAVNVRDVVKGKDSIKSGIEKVRELFKANRLKISQTCENLIAELETYSYPDKKDGHNEEENPIKEGDHALDALRYAITSLQANSRSKAVTYIPQARRY